MLADASSRLALVALLSVGFAGCAPQRAPGRVPASVAPAESPPHATDPPGQTADVPSRTWFVPSFQSMYHEHSVWSPDGRFALMRQRADRALLFGAAQASPIAGLPLIGEWQVAVWSPDGKRLAATADVLAPRISVLTLAELERPTSLPVPGARNGDTPVPVGFLPDGKRLLVRVTLSTARVLDAGTGAALGPELPVAERAPMALSWTDPLLAHTVAPSGFAITNVETGKRVFSSERTAQAMVWFTKGPKLAVKSDRATFVWEADQGLVEVPGSGDPTWDRRGDRLALFSPLGGSRSSDDHDRCSDCLRPVRWNGVIEVATRREIPTTGFLPDGKRHELSSFSLVDLETYEARPLRPPPELVWGSLHWIGEGALVMDGKRWDTKVDLATGRAVAWAAQEQRPHWSFDPERRVACEGDRWTVRDRFTGTLIARLAADTTCKDTDIRLLRTPLVAYTMAHETRILDASTSKTLARLAGSRADLNLSVDPTGERLAFFEKGRTFVLTVETLARAPWGPPGARATGWADARTLTLTTTGGGADLAVRDGVALEASPRSLEEIPARPFARRGVTFPRRSPSGRFLAQGEPPAFILRVSDGAALRLIIIETPERPYSVLVDEQGRFTGDDEAARLLTYASGTSLDSAKIHTGLEVADALRRPQEVAAFFQR